LCFFSNLFWKLVELRAFPSDRRLSVLVHGGLDIHNILFQYEDTFDPDPTAVTTAATAATTTAAANNLSSLSSSIFSSGNLRKNFLNLRRSFLFRHKMAPLPQSKNCPPFLYFWLQIEVIFFKIRLK
jgi:hypothetical protein